jgi:hypothetical protein
MSIRANMPTSRFLSSTTGRRLRLFSTMILIASATDASSPMESGLGVMMAATLRAATALVAPIVPEVSLKSSPSGSRPMSSPCQRPAMSLGPKRTPPFATRSS